MSIIHANLMILILLTLIEDAGLLIGVHGNSVQAS